jgi:hypothetical protein
MKPARAAKSFDYDATNPQFYADINRFDDATREAVAKLMERIIRNPYEPALVRKCYLNPANEIFEYFLSAHNVTLSWTTTARNKLSITDPRSLLS